MKIREVRSYVLQHPLPETEVFGSSKGWHTVRQALVVEIVTDEGLSGFGEGYGPPQVTRTLIDDLYAPRLRGRDPLEHAVIWEDLYNTYRDYGRKGWPIAAISAVDITLWDLKGKVLGQPVATLLGGAFRTRVQAYATGLYRHRTADNARALAREAETYAADGFRAMKMKIGFGVAEDVRNVGGDLAWLEEPVVPEDVEGYCELAQNPLKRAGDVLELPAGPGLGLEIDRRTLERYRV